MARVRVVDDSIWFSHINGDDALRERLASLREGDRIDLYVNGILGSWARMRDGRDGRPTLGIKPIAAMRDIWARWRREPQKVVDIRLPDGHDAYLASVQSYLTEWDSAEDNEAFRDL